MDYYRNQMGYYQSEINRCDESIQNNRDLINDGFDAKVKDATRDIINNSITDYEYLRNSALAMLDAIDATMLNKLFDAYENNDVDNYAIITGKLLCAGLGYDDDEQLLDAINANLVDKYLDLYNNSFGLRNGTFELTDSYAEMFGYDTIAELTQAVIDSADALNCKKYGAMISQDPYGNPTSWLNPESPRFNFILAMYCAYLVA